MQLTPLGGATTQRVQVDGALARLDGEAVLAMPTRPEMANRRDVVHGGFIALLADTAMGRAMSSRLPEGEPRLEHGERARAEVGILRAHAVRGHEVVHADRLHLAAPYEHIVSVLRRLGTLLRAAHAGARFS